MILEALAVMGVSQSYAIAALIAAAVRILILSKQPPPPRPTYFEILRQALITFIFVAAAEPVAILFSIHESYATILGIAVALHGTDRVAEYVKDILKLLLPEKVVKEIEKQREQKKDHEN
ncbi:hypothetical protein [Vreelandella sedimenti]|uniref:hypothetical protein n=1 Tax=Vreelandella sedimenti TaxID=2729618 RepID=UPI00257CED71|nr:hypothetical protein [Halomonas sp. UBA3173]|tara:strand:- start:156164 stop:156523 length:360 start_codon:yes stop_codon:yes gene_type:complete